MCLGVAGEGVGQQAWLSAQGSARLLHRDDREALASLLDALSEAARRLHQPARPWSSPADRLARAALQEAALRPAYPPVTRAGEALAPLRPSLLNLPPPARA